MDMKKAIPYLITFAVVIVAVIVANQFQTLKPVDADGKAIEGNGYKFKIGRKKKS